MNEGLRDEGSRCEELVGKFGVGIFTRKDLYVAIKDQQGRNADENRLLSETLKSFENNGLKLSVADLDKVRALKQELASAESQFSTNLNNDNTTVELSEAELAGLPADYVAGLARTPDGSKYVLTTRENDASIVLNNATNSEARRKWFSGYHNRQAAPNTTLLEKAIGLRQQIATLMGYPTWADYRIHGRMASDANTVMKFLTNLKDKLGGRTRDDLAKLLKFKQEGEPSAQKLDAWDVNYFSYQLKKRDYSLDDEKIREYFPADLVVAAMFEVYSQLLGVHYTEVSGAQVWSPDVKLYRIEDSKDNHLIGFFYTDFIPRANKYGHAAAFPLILGQQLENGSYSYPVASIVANLSAPSNGKPSLLSHDDVDTIFHEFGHIMHQTLTTAPYASLAGSSVAQDFVEAPSQMLENWVWDPVILNKLSGHYQDHSQKLPPELLKQMIEARNFNQGYRYMRQLFFGLTDMSYHTATGPVDTVVVMDKLYEQLFGIKALEGGHDAASFGHLMGGYDAGYYGYMWSEVYATDMFTRFSSSGLLNATVGGEYRQAVLERGNMEDALELLKRFLGREPNSDAFFAKLGIH
jgi:thimet oligopeptidase